MITYRSCSDVSVDLIFEAFSQGYSDYIVPVKMDRETFASRFFGPEGNELNRSFLALDDGAPVGLVLGGVRLFDGIRTMRCGALCTAPGHRGQGVGRRLFSLHMAAAEEAGCGQRMLEVITTNANARRLYEKSGYRAGHTLKYYSLMHPRAPAGDPPLPVRALDFLALDAYRATLPDCHVNWQNDLPALAHMADSLAVLAAFDCGAPVALIAMAAQGRIVFLHVRQGYRGRGLAAHLIGKAAQAQNAGRVTAAFPDNALLEGFLRKAGFAKDAIEQVEMYLPCGLRSEGSE